MELSTFPGCTGWKAYSNQMSTRARQPLPQLQGLPLDCTPGPGGWRLQVPVDGCGGSRVKLRCSYFQAHRFEAQNRGDSIGFPDSESLVIGGPKVKFFHPRGRHLPPQALANEGLLQPRYGLKGEGLQL